MPHGYFDPRHMRLRLHGFSTRAVHSHDTQPLAFPAEASMPQVCIMLNRLLLVLFILLAAPALAQQSSASLPHTRVEIVAETPAPKAGSRFALALKVTPAKGWHTYYEYPGDTGMAPRPQWTLPDGVRISPFRFPVPETFVVSGLMNHVYAGENILLADVDVPENASDTLPIRVKLDWLVCDDRLCVPEQAELGLDLNIGDGRIDPRAKPLFDRAYQALPRPLSETAHFALVGQKLRLSVPFADAAGITSAHFFAQRDDAIRFAAPQTIRHSDDVIIIETELLTDAPDNIAQLPGLLRLERGTQLIGLQLSAVPGHVPAGELLLPASNQQTQPFVLALGLAVLGGLLLNLMPCVFPILSLKALSLARSGQSTRTAQTEALAYTLGILIVTVLLGLAAILIAQAGRGAGWAFQLQDPRVIMLLMLLVFAIGLNFTGLFEVSFGTANFGHQLASRPGAMGAFFTGTLAAFVATPCTGPFMAGALGAALFLPPAMGLAIFAGLGLGLALPFLAVGFLPPLRRLLPKPGAWMETFRHILSVPMLVTALGLGWVLGRQAGSDQLVVGLSAALGMALLLWMAGLRQRRARSGLLPLLLALTLGLGSPFLLQAQANAAPERNNSAPLASLSQDFSEQNLQQALATGQPLFLYFTADWCLTCKVNEKGALADARVAAHFREAGIQVMIGDWTSPDSEIARFLERNGRAGIPLYLYYGTDGQVKELPQLLTVNMLIELAS